MMVDSRTRDMPQVQYTQMQRGSLPMSAGSCYSICSGSLPSHFQSINVKPEVNITIEKTESAKPDTRTKTRLVYVILLVVFVASTAIAVTVAVSEIRAIQDAYKTLPNGLLAQNQTTGTPVVLTTPVPPKMPPPRPVRPDIHHVPDFDDYDERTACANNCSIYGEAKFESMCLDGFCVCDGELYQRDTCLPIVNGCRITKHRQSKDVSIWGNAATIFKCRTRGRGLSNTNASNIYVIGIYGNHFSDATTVNVLGRARRPIRLVLASFYPVRWNLQVADGIVVQKVVLLAENKMSTSHLQLNSGKLGNASTIVEMKLLPFVGYGDDRYHSDTTEMLRKITEIYGHVTSFTGASFADKITVRV